MTKDDKKGLFRPLRCTIERYAPDDLALRHLSEEEIRLLPINQPRHILQSNTQDVAQNACLSAPAPTRKRAVVFLQGARRLCLRPLALRAVSTPVDPLNPRKRGLPKECELSRQKRLGKKEKKARGHLRRASQCPRVSHVQVEQSYSSTLVLDREWLLTDAQDQSVRAMPVLPALRERFTTMAALLHGSVPVQLALKAAAVAAKQQQGRFERWQVLVKGILAEFATFDGFPLGIKLDPDSYRLSLTGRTGSLNFDGLQGNALGSPTSHRSLRLFAIHLSGIIAHSYAPC